MESEAAAAWVEVTKGINIIDAFFAKNSEQGMYDPTAQMSNRNVADGDCQARTFCDSTINSSQVIC